MTVVAEQPRWPSPRTDYDPIREGTLDQYEGIQQGARAVSNLSASVEEIASSSEEVQSLPEEVASMVDQSVIAAEQITSDTSEIDQAVEELVEELDRAQADGGEEALRQGSFPRGPSTVRGEIFGLRRPERVARTSPCSHGTTRRRRRRLL